MKVCITNNCVGCGACAAVNPEVFEINNNYATVNPYKIDGREESCIYAALHCPADAIDLSEI